MGDRVEAAIKAIRATGIDKRRSRQIIGELIAQEIVQWPTEPRIISNVPDLLDLPVGTVLRAAAPASGDVTIVFHRDYVAWWGAGSDEPWAISEIPLPAEVLA